MGQINKNIIYQKFTNIINEYLKMVENTEFIKNNDNSKNIINIGLNTIIHVFKIILIKTTNIDLAYYYSQKSYYCYLEYVEQINMTSLIHNLNNTDVVIFVYNKSISNIDSLNISNTLVGLNSNNKSKKTLVLDVDEIGEVLENVLQITKILLYLENPNFNFKEISYIANDFILKFIILSSTDIIPIFKFIENILDKMIEPAVMTYEKYTDFLNVMYKKIKIIIKTKNYPSNFQINERIIQLFHINKCETIQYFNTKTTEQFIGYLFQFN